MTNKEKIEQLESAILAIEKKITANSRIATSLSRGFKSLELEWGIYESRYRAYIEKKRRIRKFLWRLYCKVMRRNIKPTRKELINSTAIELARVFYKGRTK